VSSLVSISSHPGPLTVPVLASLSILRQSTLDRGKHSINAESILRTLTSCSLAGTLNQGYAQFPQVANPLHGRHQFLFYAYFVYVHGHARRIRIDLLNKRNLHCAGEYLLSSLYRAAPQLMAPLESETL
jgi:hypothetical protein